MSEGKFDWITLTLVDHILISIGSSIATGTEYFRLGTKIPIEVWYEIKPYFKHTKSLWYKDREIYNAFNGWVTTDEHVEKVMEILRERAEPLVTPEHIETIKKYYKTLKKF